MFKKFYPSVTVRSVDDIDFKKYYDAGYRGLLFDIDNTLVEHEAPYEEKTVKLFDALRKLGFKTCIISNNNEPRAKAFAEGIGSPYIYKAGKPKPDGYIRAMKKIGIDKDAAIMVGDQMFTDIWGANNAGIYSILVDKIARDPYFHIRLKRLGEAVVRPFMKAYLKRHPAHL